MPTQHIRRRRIRSGSFSPSKNDDSQSTDTRNTSVGMMSAKRDYISSSSGMPVNVDFRMFYSISNANRISSITKKPLLCIHGGPGIPSDYLVGLSNAFPNRTVILYDQIGCGKSNEPSDINAYSIDNSVQDLVDLVQFLKNRYGLNQFHMLGHSFGGIIAYEYMKKTFANKNLINSPTLLSITLSSTPFDVHQVDKDSESQMDVIRDSENYSTTEEVNQSFQQTFVCRTESLPQPLQVAFSRRGKVCGQEMIQDYIAEPLPPTFQKNDANTDNNIMLPSILLTRGEFDFVTARQSIDNWKETFARSNYDHSIFDIDALTVNNSGHYSMLDNSSFYTDALDTFLSRTDNAELEARKQ